MDLAHKLGLPVSTLNTIAGQQEELQKNLQVSGPDAKQAQGAKHDQMEDILLTWWEEVRAAG